MGKKGFTLLEILVVLTVLAILIGIAVPRIKAMQDQANIQKTKSELKTLQTAVETYKLNHAAYPANIGAALTGETSPVITTALSDPFSSGGAAPYGYQVTGNFYVLYGYGADQTVSISAISSTGTITGSASLDVCLTNASDGTGSTCLR